MLLTVVVVVLNLPKILVHEVTICTLHHIDVAQTRNRWQTNEKIKAPHDRSPRKNKGRLACFRALLLSFNVWYYIFYWSQLPWAAGPVALIVKFQYAVGLNPSLTVLSYLVAFKSISARPRVRPDTIIIAT